MNKLFHTLRWDFIKAYRYRIVAAAAFVTVVYVLVLLNVPETRIERLLVLLIFNDPAALGMLFIGSMVLFERSENTWNTLRISPQTPAQYLWGKTIMLTALALGCSLVIAWAGYGWRLAYGWLSLGVVLTSVFFTFLGFRVVVGCRSFNEYITKMSGLLIPLALPFLSLLEIVDIWLWYLIPSMPALILLEAAFSPVSGWELIYALIYLTAAVVAVYFWALRSFDNPKT